MALGKHRKLPCPDWATIDVPGFCVTKTIDMQQIVGMHRPTLQAVLHRAGEEAVAEVKAMLGKKGYGRYNFPIEFSLKEDTNTDLHRIVLKAETKAYKVRKNPVCNNNFQP